MTYQLCNMQYDYDFFFFVQLMLLMDGKKQAIDSEKQKPDKAKKEA